MTLTVQLGLLEDAGLIRLASVQPELEYLFRHGLIQDAAYSTLLRGQRQRWHLATAEVLESACQSQGNLGEFAPILASHFSLAGERQRACHYLLLAADAAFANFANAEAVNFYRQALDIASQPVSEYDAQLLLHLYSRHGRALELKSHFEAALKNYRAMEATALQHHDKTLELAAVMARATIHSGANMAQDLPQAVRLLERAGALAHDLGDMAAEANIKWTLMLNNSMAGGDSELSGRYGQEALDLARASGQRNLTALILTDLWFSRANNGEWELARAGVVEGCEIARDLGNLTVVAEGLLRISMVDMVAGRYDDSLAKMVEATETAEALNSNDMRALTRLTAGVIYADRGDWDRAIEFSQVAVRLGELTDNVTVLIGTRSDLGRVYALLGDMETGLALTRKALADSSRFALVGPWASSALIHLRLQLGDVDGAAAELAQLPDYRDLMRRAGFVPMMWTSLGLAEVELAQMRGDPAGAARLARELIERFDQAGVVYRRPEARLWLGRALMALDRLDEARQALQTARVEAEAMNARRLLWPIIELLAEIAARRGEAEAGSLRQRAGQIVRYIADHAPNPALRQTFLARPEVQATLREGA